MKTLLLAMILGTMALHAQIDPLEGLWPGYDGEWVHVSRQLVALAGVYCENSKTKTQPHVFEVVT